MIETLPFGRSIKTFLESNQHYRRWKHSELGLWLWRRFARKQSDIIRREDLFYRQLLGPLRSHQTPIFDIGANVGWLSKTFLDFSEHVVAIEPDSFNQQVLTDRLGHSKSFYLVPQAVSSEEGFRDFLIQKEGSALNTLSEKWRQELESGFLPQPWLFTAKKIAVPTTTLDRLIAEHGLPSLAKIDVEGHELEVMRGLSQPIPLVVFEANLPVFLEETKEIICMLEAISDIRLNYTLGFQLQLPEFAKPADFLSILEQLGKCSTDIVCKMSNFNTYYEIGKL